MVSCDFSARVYSKFGHHPHPIGYLCSKLHLSRPPLLSQAMGKNHVLNHSTTNVTTVIEVQSASARLLAGTWRPLVSVITKLNYAAISFHRWVWYRALCVYSKFGHHPHPIGYLCAKFHFFRSLHAALAHGDKSRTQSLTQLIWCPGNRSACTLE